MITKNHYFQVYVLIKSIKKLLSHIVKKEGEKKRVKVFSIEVKLYKMRNIVQCIEVAENIMCIYRNYLFCRQRYKTIIVLRIVIEVVIFALMIFNNFFFIIREAKLGIDLKYLYFLNYTLFFGDVLLGFFSVSRKAAYKIFIDNLMTVNDVYHKDINYNRSLKQLRIVFYTTFIVLSAMAISLTVINVTVRYLASVVTGSILDTFSENFSLLRNEITFILEYISLYTFLSILANLLKCLNSTIFEIQKKLLLKEEQSEYSHSILVEKLKQWTELYECLVEGSKQLAACFKNHVNMLLILFP